VGSGSKCVSLFGVRKIPEGRQKQMTTLFQWLCDADSGINGLCLPAQTCQKPIPVAKFTRVVLFVKSLVRIWPSVLNEIYYFSQSVKGK